uniref:Ig-like domain-containing protein n=1 Tax=Pygocentrus nattereri TaxID=42514 RepID=A0A3B4BWH3_PYGNA
MGCGRAANATHRAHFGQGSGLIFLDNVGCSGNECSLYNCSHNGFYKHNCNHSKDAGVICSGVLQSPTFNLTSSHSAVSSGEAVQFKCINLNSTCISANFSLYKNEQSIKTQTAESSAAFNLTVDSSHQGQYSCDYSYHREITSPRSSSINITVVNLLQPNITLSAPDGWFHWWLQGSEVIRGYNFSITCSIEPQYPGGSFHLEFSGTRNRTQSAVNHSNTFFFPKADFVDQGNYSCVYEVTVSSRTFSSPTTELLAVTVKVSPVPFIGSGVAAGLLLILVPIIIVLIKRCQKRKGQMSVKMDHSVCEYVLF